MKKIISGIGFFLSALVIGNGIVSYCEVSGLKERIQDLETESDWIGKQVSAAPFNQNKKYVFESYDEKSVSVKQQVYRIHSYGENQIVLQKEEPDNQEIFLIKVKDDYLAVYKKADMQLFETTNIPIEVLPSDEQVQVLAGKEVTGTEALYSFLENYSS